jgi:NUDIX domain-containing protein
MDLFQAFPNLRKQTSMGDKKIALLGISATAWDDAGAYFEIGKPKYWKADDAGNTIIGLGGLGGTLKPGETPLACLRREMQEELGVRPRIEQPEQTFVIQDWDLVGTLNLRPSRKHPTPLMILLMPPQLGGPNMPDHVAIVCFRTRLRGTPHLGDLHGILHIDNHILIEYFSQPERSLIDTTELSGVSIQTRVALPSNSILRPVLTARAYQIILNSGYVPPHTA